MESIIHVLSGISLALFVLICFLAKGNDPGSKATLACSIAMMVIAIAYLFSLSDMDSIIVLLSKASRMAPADTEASKAAIGIWTIGIPLVVGGVSVNLFSAWLTAPLPKK